MRTKSKGRKQKKNERKEESREENLPFQHDEVAAEKCYGSDHPLDSCEKRIDWPWCSVWGIGYKSRDRETDRSKERGNFIYKGRESCALTIF